jgi:hypothetical protein
MRHSRLIALGVFIVLSIGMPVDVVRANSAGKSCSKVGALSGTATRPLVCRKVKGKRVWVRTTSASQASNSGVPGSLYGTVSANYYRSLGVSLIWGPAMKPGRAAVSGFRLEFSTPTTPWTAVATIPAGQYLQYVKDDRLDGTNLKFRIAAINRFGVGVFTESNWVTYGVEGGSLATGTVPPSGQQAGAGSTATSSPSSETVSQSNARKKAASYLRSSSFSRSGLIKQLQFEGFSNSDASYGTDAQNADWRAQAVLKAASYLRSSSFSRSGLIRQLEFEGFSSAEAVHGVDANPIDWNQQAALKAASYLRSSAFSRSGLINQLLFEGFTQSQAEYGVSTTGL